MQTVTGRRVVDVTPDELVEAAAKYARSVLDIGTGDGRFVLAVAAARPEAYVVGVDANAAAMAEASRRAARPAQKGGLPNARFVVAAAETLGGELPSFADEVHVHFPWGSLLRGLAGPEDGAIDNLAGVARPGSELTLLLSVADADAAMGLAPLDEVRIEQLAQRYAERDLTPVEVRRAITADLVAARSTWAKRLAAGGRRPAWLLRFRRG